MKKSIPFTLTMLASFLLCGCVGMNSQFNCPVKAHGSCMPLDQVNQAATQGMFHDTANAKLMTSQTVFKNIVPSAYPMLMKTSAPIRYGETVQRIWIAPYRDTSDNYHEPSVVYTVVRSGHWIGEPVKSLRNT